LDATLRSRHGRSEGGGAWLRIMPDGAAEETHFPDRFDPYRFTAERIWGVQRDALDVASVAWMLERPRSSAWSVRTMKFSGRITLGRQPRAFTTSSPIETLQAISGPRVAPAMPASVDRVEWIRMAPK
jgi:hypothetical protein